MEFIDNISSKESTQINIDISEKNTEMTKRKFQTWSKREDSKLMELYAKSPKKWTIISSLMENRNQNQCLHRYLRLSKSDKHLKVWSTIEDELALKLIKQYGKNWKIISQKMGTKTGKQIKQKFNSMMNIQMQSKLKQQSGIIGNKQKKAACKLLIKSPKQLPNRFNNLYNLCSSQRTLPQSLLSAQCQQKSYKQSAKTSKFYSQQMKVRCKQQSHFIYDSEKQFTNTRNIIYNDRVQPDFKQLNSLISRSIQKIQDNRQINESVSCGFSQNQIQ